MNNINKHLKQLKKLNQSKINNKQKRYKKLNLIHNLGNQLLKMKNKNNMRLYNHGNMKKLKN